MKRLISVALCILLCCLLTACGETAPVVTATEVTARIADSADGVRRVPTEATDYAVDVLFEADGTLTDLCLLRLQLSTYDHAIYKATESIPLGTVTVDEPVVAALNFPGDMSAWGFSFTDAHGVVQYRTLYISGEDGSLVTAEGIL